MKKDLYLNNFSSNLRNSFNWLMGIIMVGAHQFNFPLIPYLLIIFLGNKKFSNFLNNKNNILILILLSLSIFSLTNRGYPLFEAINVSRFFFGIPFLYLFLNSKLFSELKYPIIIAFIGWNIIELIFVIVTGEPPFYISNFFIQNFGNDESIIRTRVGANNETFRLLGPALNSSINGTISGCILIASIFNKEIIFPDSKVSKLQEKLISISTAIIFFFSASGTGYGVFSLLLINKFIWPTLKDLIKNLRIKVVSLTLLAFGLIASIQALILIPTVFQKLEIRYILYVAREKRDLILQFLNFNDVGDILFGIDYNPLGSLFTNGDFIILSLISALGIVFLVFLIFIMLKIYPANRIYFFALLISSLHYGTLFSVTGQIICSLVFASKNKITSSSKFNYQTINRYSENKSL